MTDRQHDLTFVDRRGARAGRAVRTAAAQVDTGAMFERIHRRQRRWMVPVVAVTATVAAVAVAILVAVQPPVTVGGLDPVTGGGAPAGLDGQDWPPPVGTVGPDGWVEVPRERMPTFGDPQDLEVVDGAFVLATEGGQVWASDDGFAWAEVPGVRASMGQRLFIGRAGSTLLVATGEGTMFAGDASGVDQVTEIGQVEALAGGPAGAVAITSTPGQGRQLVATADGQTWTPVGLELPLRSVAFDDNRFVGVTDGPDAQVLEADRPDGPWVAHPGSDTLPDGFWGVEPTEPGFVLIPRADGDQGLDPILWWTTEGHWATAQFPSQGSLVIDDATTIDAHTLIAIGTDTSRPELDADRLYRIDRNASETSVVETGDAFGPTAVLRRAHAVSDGTTTMVAYGRRRAGPGDGLTLWVRRPVEDPQTQTTWWCPKAAVTAAERQASGNLELLQARLSTVGEIRDWQGRPIGDPTDTIPDPDPAPQPWLEPLPADQPAVVCMFHADGFSAPGGGYRHASFVATLDGEARPFRFHQNEPSPGDYGPQSSTPLHETPSQAADPPSTDDDTSVRDTVDVSVRVGAAARVENRERDVVEVPGGHGTLTIDRFDLMVEGWPDPSLPPSGSVSTAEDPSVLPTIASTRADFDRVGLGDDLTEATFTTEAGEWQALYVPTTDSSVAALQITTNTLIKIHAPHSDLDEIERLARLLDIPHARAEADV